jgi:lysophospholipase L1-like esterase
VLKKIAATVVAIILACVLRADSSAQTVGEHWVGAWSTAVHAPLRFPGAPEPPSLANKTIRMNVRPTMGGEHVRIRLSNAFGTKPLTISAAHIALVAEGSKIVQASDRVLKFGGRESVSIPPGAPMLSDPLELKFTSFAELAISLHVTSDGEQTLHLFGQKPTYISDLGDFTSTTEIPTASTTNNWFWLSDVEVLAPSKAAATVTLGDSITDGAGSKQGEYNDWPDLLADRLAAEKRLPPMAVLNEGIGGNRVLHDAAGINALARFDRDVLSHPGVVNLIVMEGINDIGWPNMKLPPPKEGSAPMPNPFATQKVTAEDIIAGLKQIVDRAHQHGIHVFGATLTPYEGANYYTEDGEVIRKAVNDWIRRGGAFDGVFDFDAAVRDPAYPSRFRDGYHMGDNLHPSVTGYKAMADAIDLSALRNVPAKTRK